MVTRNEDGIPRLPGAQDDEDSDIPADATLVQVPADRERLFSGEANFSNTAQYTLPVDAFGPMGADDGTIMQAPNPVAFAPPLPAAGAPPPVPPPAPTSDRVLLPPQAPEPARAAASGPAGLPAWVLIYVFVALLLAVAGAVILFVEARILGHF